MRNRFVRTENVTRFLTGLAALQDRGAEEACLMVVDGIPGLGKTATISWWAAQQDCTYLRAKKEWTPAWMMREILASVGVRNPAYSFERMYAQALEALGARAREAERADEVFAVVIDEVDHISKSARLLETLRDLSDMLEIPFILVGMGRVRGNLTKFPQIASRCGPPVEFRKASFEDVVALAEGLCEVKIEKDLLQYLHTQSNGLFREIKEGLKNIERFAKLNGGVASLSAMEGKALLNDRRSGKAIMVRA